MSERAQLRDTDRIFIYHLLDANGVVVYVGQSKCPERRLLQHLSNPVSAAMRRWLETETEMPTLRVVQTCLRVDADRLECEEVARQRALGAAQLNISGGPGAALIDSRPPTMWKLFKELHRDGRLIVTDTQGKVIPHGSLIDFLLDELE